MRGAFVACFGRVDQAELERVADQHRWHHGTPEYQAAPGFHVASQAHPGDGPHVELRGGTTFVVHGSTNRSFEDILALGKRFVVVETDGETLRAARDPMGLAPLFYRVVGDGLWLATEVSPLVALGSASPDLEALSAQAALVPHATRTGFAGINRLLPGHSLHVTRDLLVTQRRYWNPGAFFGSFESSRREAADELWARLLGAVDQCVEGQTGILLSGGLDSAAVTAAAAQLRRPLALVHVAFPDHADATEELYARDVADRAHTDLDVVTGHTEPWHPEEDLELTVIPYLTPPTYTANTGLARLAERSIGVVLDGNDGDGLLGIAGREWGELVVTGSVMRLWELAATYGARRVVSGIANDVIPSKVLRTVRRLQRPPTYLEETERYFDPLIRNRMRSTNHERWRQPLGEWRWRQLRQVLPVTTARMEEHELRGSRYGIDLRHPFAERDLVEFAVSLPAAVKSDPMRSKSLLRDALAGHAPERVVQRIEKPGYLSVLERRVQPDQCLEWVKESGVRLPLVNYETLFRDGAHAGTVPLFLLLVLARAHVFAAGI